MKTENVKGINSLKEYFLNKVLKLEESIGDCDATHNYRSAMMFAAGSIAADHNYDSITIDFEEGACDNNSKDLIALLDEVRGRIIDIDFTEVDTIGTDNSINLKIAFNDNVRIMVITTTGDYVECYKLTINKEVNV